MLPVLPFAASWTFGFAPRGRLQSLPMVSVLPVPVRTIVTRLKVTFPQARVSAPLKPVIAMVPPFALKVGEPEILMPAVTLRVPEVEVKVPAVRVKLKNERVWLVPLKLPAACEKLPETVKLRFTVIVLV